MIGPRRSSIAARARVSGRRQYIAAGLVDEISIHLVPVLFGGGTRLFEELGGEHIGLETAEVVKTANATHLRFRVLK